jgi:hypothetical protein
MKKPESAQRAPSALEQCVVESSAGGFCEGTLVLKGLPLDHVQAYCMGDYTKQARILNGRSVYVGGRDGDMALYFENSHKGWKVTHEESIGVGGFIMCTSDSAITPDRIEASWVVSLGHQPAPYLRVRKFGGRETILELSGPPSAKLAASCMGRYTRDTCGYNDKPTYKGTRLADGKAIWFCEGNWRVGPEEEIGTEFCYISVEECARTPDAVQSMWMAEATPELDKRIQVCSASVQQSPHDAPSQQLSSAPPKLAVIGSGINGDSYDGIYTKQLREVDSRVVYEGGRNGEQAIWCIFRRPNSEHCLLSTWAVGEVENIGTDRFFMSRRQSVSLYNDTHSPAISPDAVTGSWSVPSMVPCSSIRVSKSKKKHTKVIEVKGVPDCYGGLELMNGKYRQSRMVGGRLTFKGGQNGRAEFWFDECTGKWCCRCEDRVGSNGTQCYMEANDTAASPNAVKAPWHVLNGFMPSPRPNVIVPSVEAAEQEVPRLLQLRLCELVAAQQRRCLGCGHEYTAQTEVVFQMECLHHHCVCCEEELGRGVCAVCAEEGGV